MIARRQLYGPGTWLFLSLLGFVAGGVCIYRATQYSHAAPSEKTIAAYQATVRARASLFGRTYYCSYAFSVDGESYSGDENCVQLSADPSIQGELPSSGEGFAEINATVYYDPANPSINSLTEFSAKSEAEYRSATALIGIALFINLPYVFLAVYAAMKNKGDRGVFVDANGTVIYPDQIDLGPAFGGLPGESERPEKSKAAANGKVTRDAYFAASHGLRELYLDVIKQIHPDHASNEADRALREQLTKEANAAFERGDDETLRRALEEYTRQAPHF